MHRIQFNCYSMKNRWIWYWLKLSLWWWWLGLSKKIRSDPSFEVLDFALDMDRNICISDFRNIREFHEIKISWFFEENFGLIKSVTYNPSTTLNQVSHPVPPVAQPFLFAPPPQPAHRPQVGTHKLFLFEPTPPLLRATTTPPVLPPRSILTLVEHHQATGHRRSISSLFLFFIWKK